MNKAFKFRIKPTLEQKILLGKTFGCVRFIYNKMLADKISHYEKYKTTLKNMPAQYKSEFEWLKEVDSLALANAQLNLETAYRNFFRRPNIGYPKFKSKRVSTKSYSTNSVNNNIVLNEDYLKLPKIGRVRIKQHRQIPKGFKLKSVTISQSPSGKYHASILFEYEAHMPQVEIKNIVGLDFSMSELYIDSSGANPHYPKYYRKAQSKLAKEQRKLSRRKKGGQNYQKQKIAILHEHIANQRKDFLHKQSRQITNDYDAVCIEDLNMRGMSQALNFGKSVADTGWGMFTTMLNYKLVEQGKKIVKIDKWFPSSKTCSSCGKVKDNLLLSERIFSCECGFQCDRDVNAAINIKNEGLRLLA